MVFFAGRRAEHFVEGGDLVAGHLAVGLGHLGAERDARNRERDPPARVAVPVVGGAAGLVGRDVPMRQVLGHPRQQVTQRPAERQVAGSDENAADNAHCPDIQRFPAPVDCCGSGNRRPSTGGFRRAALSLPLV